MRLFNRRASRVGLAPVIAQALDLGKGERVLAYAVDDNTSAHVVATTYALVVVASTGEGAVRRRWLSVDAASWEPETATLTVTWADGGRAGQWSFRHHGDLENHANQQTLLPETLRERVQASVVLSTRLALGDRRTGRVAIRQDFATRELISQTILGRHTRADDPEVAAHVHAALAHLLDQVGLQE
jgi:hypothetical protein